MRALILLCFFLVIVTLTGTLALPRWIAAARLLTGPRDEAAVASYLLDHKNPADYQAAAEQALAAKDDDLAASISTLAQDRAVTLPADLATRIAAAQVDAHSRMGADAWEGFVSGDVHNEPALAGAVAADLTGVGDVRDLFQQAELYLSGQDVDPLVIGLATVGLGLTAATVVTVGMALPERAGVSTLKAVKRAGRLSPALAGEVSLIAAEALDRQALTAMGSSLARLDLAAARGASARLLKPGALRTLKGLGSDVAAIGGNSGYRATLATLATARSAEEVGVIARLSNRFGKATRAVLVLGGTAFTFASFAASASIWFLSAVLWAVGALLAIAQFGRRIGRWIWPRRPVPRLQLA